MDALQPEFSIQKHKLGIKFQNASCYGSRAGLTKFGCMHTHGCRVRNYTQMKLMMMKASKRKHITTMPYNFMCVWQCA